MTNRGQEIKISLKDRIAALGLDGHGAPSTSSTQNSASNLHPVSYSSSSSSTPFAGVRDKAARFESIGGVPVPRGSFGLGAPAAFNTNRKAGELYGNRIPSGSSRSPGTSPSRSPADDSANIDFTKFRLRSASSVGSIEESGDAETSVRLEVVPPTPGFPFEDAKKEESPTKETENTTQLTSSPSPLVQEVTSEITLITTAPSAEVVVDTAQEVTIPEVIRAQELEAIPESPLTSQTPVVARKPAEKVAVASKRRSLMLAQPPPSNVARRLSASIDPQTIVLPDTSPTTPEMRSSALSPESTASPRRTRSLAPSRSNSITSNSGVFTSPPPDEGEISGGGSTSSPTLAAVITDQMDLHELQGLSIDESKAHDSTSRPSNPISPIDPTTLSLSISNSELEDNNRNPGYATNVDLEDIPDDSSGEEPGNLLRHEVLNASELFYNANAASTIEDGQKLGDSSYPKRSTSLAHGDVAKDDSSQLLSQSSALPVGRLQEVIAETASPARVLRELRQLGMEKMTSIVIPPRRSSVLSMMLPSVASDNSPSVESPSGGLYRAVEEQLLTAKPRESTDDSTIEDIVSPSRRFNSVGRDSPTTSQSRPIAAVTVLKKEATVELSPSAASMNSNSGTSNASHGQLSARPSVEAPISPMSPNDPLTSGRTPTGLSRFSTSQTSVTSTQKSYIPFVTDGDSQSDRNLTPSPPPSFRSLYSSGRLPPSSRGPGPHLPSGKVPLIQRAVTLMSRALPPAPKDESPPRRSSSAFNVLRSRTTSKTKKKAAEQAATDARPSTSSDMTATDHGGRTRLRTKSSPSSTRPSSEAPPPVPQLPPVVILNDDKESTPIAKMFMEQRQRNQSQDTPPSAFRSSSPSPSISSTQNTISSYIGPPVHLFSPSFDDGIFDSFPEVPNDLPTGSMVARHTKQADSGGRSRLGAFPSHSYSDLQSQNRPSFESTIAYSRSDDGHGTVKSPRGTQRVDEFGNADELKLQPGRRKASSSRKLIPGWYDEDEEQEEAETGWASISVVRQRLM